jgi:catechol 2,3-dioxygenase-like lactoylglutathione lyase family enzyme
MSLHRINSVTIGVPDVEKTSEFYRDFGMTEATPGLFATADGGEQLRLVHSPLRRLLELSVGADNPDDVDRVASQVSALNVAVQRTEDGLMTTDPGTGVRVRVEVAPRIHQDAVMPPVYNGPGRIDRLGRSAELPQEGPIPAARPRKLGHVVIGTTDLEPSKRFFMEGIGFKLSDQMRDRAFFLRCSEDHHNLLLQHAPVKLHNHSSCQG